MHALATGHSPAYLSDNADGIRQDWPRVPLPATREALLTLAALRRRVAALLDTETPVPGVTVGEAQRELRAIANVSRVGGARWWRAGVPLWASRKCPCYKPDSLR